MIEVIEAEKMCEGRVVVVPIHHPDGPREALVVQDKEGAIHAYLNRCEHVPVPIDAGSRKFFSASGESFVCRTHGALFRLEDGFCFSGPCLGRSLERFPIRIDDGVVMLEAEAGSAARRILVTDRSDERTPWG